MDIPAYLKRIRYEGSPRVSVETLRSLHRAHLFAVPFENLDISLGRPIVLSEDALYRKIVEQNRGGFCYELNGLFSALLRGLGFEVERLSAGVMDADGVYGPPFDHMTLRVRLEEDWLADVGFGDCFLDPLRLEEDREQIDGTVVYRIVREGELRILQKREADSWRDQYRFTLVPYELSDYDPMCRYHQTSSESHFTRKRVCTLPTSDGRITLSDHRLIRTRSGGSREERTLEDEEIPEALAAHFSIRL